MHEKNMSTNAKSECLDTPGLTEIIDQLDSVSGGSSSDNPAGLKLGDNGGPAETAANNQLAQAWNKAHHIGAAKGGNYTKADGRFPALYRYEYANGSRFAPGADD
jgi:hypothetical protein